MSSSPLAGSVRPLGSRLVSDGWVGAGGAVSGADSRATGGGVGAAAGAGVAVGPGTGAVELGAGAASGGSLLAGSAARGFVAAARSSSVTKLFTAPVTF